MKSTLFKQSKQKKMHISTIPYFNEAFYFTSRTNYLKKMLRSKGKRVNKRSSSLINFRSCGDFPHEIQYLQ